ncbi:hypothetical protein [Spiroplasma sp. DGKH1]|uniref:hypothetical protein n=1 Tax=Spiroplasma sp. DGKH1 TaxID=3050074 RepID=UPI0034C64289
MDSKDNQKIPSYYNHQGTFFENNNSKQNTSEKNEPVAPATPTSSEKQVVKLTEVISPLFGKDLNSAHSQTTINYTSDDNSPIAEIVEAEIKQKIGDNGGEEKLASTPEPYQPIYKKYDPQQDEQMIKSMVKKPAKLSEQAEKTQAFLFKPRKNGENIFGDRTEELTVELEQLKEKIKKTDPRKNLYDIYEQTTMFEGIEEQKEINSKFRNIIRKTYQINTDFPNDMSLLDRKKQIMHNSIAAGSTRYKIARELKENNLDRQFLRRPKPIIQGSSEHQQMMENLKNANDDPAKKQVVDFYTSRNPYYMRKLNLEEENLKEADENRRERIKNELNNNEEK